jgi:hypothetical protein
MAGYVSVRRESRAGFVLACPFLFLRRAVLEHPGLICQHYPGSGHIPAVYLEASGKAALVLKI